MSLSDAFTIEAFSTMRAMEEPLLAKGMDVTHRDGLSCGADGFLAASDILRAVSSGIRWRKPVAAKILTAAAERFDLSLRR